MSGAWPCISTQLPRTQLGSSETAPPDCALLAGEGGGGGQGSGFQMDLFNRCMAISEFMKFYSPHTVNV
eukprot:COSAG01_NODE_7970_length_2970_cov_1.643330_6_plen_69_part_00